MDTKRCTQCKLIKKLTEFNTSKKIRDGYRSACKECDKKGYERRYKNNEPIRAAKKAEKEKIKQIAKEDKLKAELERGTKQCFICKEFKPFSEFANDKSSYDKLFYNCKECNYLNRTEIVSSIEEKNKKWEYLQNVRARTPQERRDMKNAGSRRNRETVRGRVLYILTTAKNRAKKNNIKFNLDLDFLLNLYKAQNGKCALTDIDFILEKPKGRAINLIPFSPSLDRIDAYKGYTKDNVRFVCTMVNIALGQHGDEVFDKICCLYINELDKQK